MPRGFEQQPLLRIERARLGGRDAEEVGVEAEQVADIAGARRVPPGRETTDRRRHDRIATVAGVYQASHDGLVITHGTDRLQYTGEFLCQRLGIPRVPIVLTGAMRPFELRNTDALQNLTEALLAVQLVAPGVYVAMHNQVLQFPGVVKDHAELRFFKP